LLRAAKWVYCALLNAGKGTPDGRAALMAFETAAGLTVADVARRYRVSEDRVRGWIRRGELRAINRRDTRCARPSWVIPPEALADFERGRAATPNQPKPKRRKPTNEVDYYPD
jgi:transposase